MRLPTGTADVAFIYWNAHTMESHFLAGSIPGNNNIEEV